MKSSDSVLCQKNNKKADSLNYEQLGLSSENNSVFENNTAHNTHRVCICSVGQIAGFKPEIRICIGRLTFPDIKPLQSLFDNLF